MCRKQLQSDSAERKKPSGRSDRRRKKDFFSKKTTMPEKPGAEKERTKKPEYKQIKDQLIKFNFIQHNYEKTFFDSVGSPFRTGYR